MSSRDRLNPVVEPHPDRRATWAVVPLLAEDRQSRFHEHRCGVSSDILPAREGSDVGMF